MPRPAAKIDLESFRKLCLIHCTYKEMAGFFEVSTRTIEKYAQKPEYRKAIEWGKAKGAISIRRAQFKAAVAGNPTMLIWLGKQYLEQRDQSDLAVTGPKGGPIEVDGSAHDVLLQRIARLANRSQKDEVKS